MTNISTWFRVSLLSIVLVTCGVVPPSVGFAQDRSGEIPHISPPTAFPGRCPATKSLTILKDPQQTDTWCGVATARIAMDYVFYRGSAPVQCDLVSPIASGLDCCDGFNRYFYNCAQNRWPEEILDSRGFSYSAPFTEDIHPPLTWGEVIDEICEEDRPYISTITPCVGCKHSVIVHGYGWHVRITHSIGGIRWPEVQVYDPYDNVSYWDWERFFKKVPSSYSHDGDTYKIRKIRTPFPHPYYPELPLCPGPGELQPEQPFNPSSDPGQPHPNIP